MNMHLIDIQDAVNLCAKLTCDSGITRLKNAGSDYQQEQLKNAYQAIQVIKSSAHKLQRDIEAIDGNIEQQAYHKHLAANFEALLIDALTDAAKDYDFEYSDSNLTDQLNHIMQAELLRSQHDPGHWSELRKLITDWLRDVIGQENPNALSMPISCKIAIGDIIRDNAESIMKEAGK